MLSEFYLLSHAGLHYATNAQFNAKILNSKLQSNYPDFRPYLNVNCKLKIFFGMAMQTIFIQKGSKISRHKD